MQRQAAGGVCSETQHQKMLERSRVISILECFKVKRDKGVKFCEERVKSIFSVMLADVPLTERLDSQL